MMKKGNLFATLHYIYERVVWMYKFVQKLPCFNRG